MNPLYINHYDCLLVIQRSLQIISDRLDSLQCCEITVNEFIDIINQRIEKIRKTINQRLPVND